MINISSVHRNQNVDDVNLFQNSESMIIFDITIVLFRNIISRVCVCVFFNSEQNEEKKTTSIFKAFISTIKFLDITL